MNRSQSAVEILSRRHVSFDGTPSSSSTYSKSGSYSKHSLPDKAQGSIILKAVAALVIIFASGITLGSFAHIQYYRRAALSPSNSSTNLQPKVLKRTQQVAWAVKTQTIQNTSLPGTTETQDATQQASAQDSNATLATTSTSTTTGVLELTETTSDPNVAEREAEVDDSMLDRQIRPAVPSPEEVQVPVQSAAEQQQQTDEHQQQVLTAVQQQHHQQQQQQEAALAAMQQQVDPNQNAAATGSELPPDFHWKLYLSYYPDLAAHGINTEESAKNHYLTIGRQEQRLYQPLKIGLRYTACGGLMNQHYSHLAAIALGIILKAEIYVPAALARNSFASYFSTDPTKNKVFWQPSPASSMWDVAYAQKYWGARGIKIHEGPGNMTLPDLSRPNTAYPTWLPENYKWEQVAHMGNVYIRSLNMGRLVAQALEILVHHVSLPHFNHAQPVLLDLPCTLFMLEANSAPDLIPEVAKSFKFAPRMFELADLVITGMGNSTFNGLHLRMEADAKDWANILGGSDKLLEMYLDACRAARFTPDTGMYLASGIFTYASSKQEQVALQLKEVSNKLHYKEMYIPKEELEKLNKEQQALIDFLVLSRAQSFVGISVSTFSYYLREYRALLGMPKSTTIMVDASKVGTEKLFFKAARVVNLAAE